MEESRDIILVCSDRDGCINEDREYYLGSSSDWRELISFRPGVVEGIRCINSLPNAKFVIVSNQSGVALVGDAFSLLTEERMWEVNEEITTRLAREGARVDASFYCPYVSSLYAEEARGKGRSVDVRYVKDDADCIKPRPGMIKKAAEKFGFCLEDIRHKFMIGDLPKDAVAGLAAGCVCFLMDSYAAQKKGKTEESKKMATDNPGRVYFVQNFLEAATAIQNMVQHP